MSVLVPWGEGLGVPTEFAPHSAKHMGLEKAFGGSGTSTHIPTFTEHPLCASMLRDSLGDINNRKYFA